MARRCYYQAFTINQPEILRVSVPPGCVVLFMDAATLKLYKTGSTPRMDGDIGPSAEFAPLKSGEWFFVCGEQVDGSFQIVRGLRVTSSGALRLTLG